MQYISIPSTLALIDGDAEYAMRLAEDLRAQGIQVDLFGDSNDLLVHADPYGYQFYVLDLVLPGIDGVDLIKLLRRRSAAGVLVVSHRSGAEVFKSALSAGADMYLAKPVESELVALAIEAVQRRATQANPLETEWRWDRRAAQLVAPDGARIDLSETDQTVIECFLEADGDVVSRDTLRQRIGRQDGRPDSDDAADGLNATIYRLRRRIERATPLLVPLQSKSRVGYVFRAALKAA